MSDIFNVHMYIRIIFKMKRVQFLETLSRYIKILFMKIVCVINEINVGTYI